MACALSPILQPISRGQSANIVLSLNVCNCSSATGGGGLSMIYLMRRLRWRPGQLGWDRADGPIKHGVWWARKMIAKECHRLVINRRVGRDLLRERDSRHKRDLSLGSIPFLASHPYCCCCCCCWPGAQVSPVLRSLFIGCGGAASSWT